MKERFIIQVAPLIPLPVMRTQVFSYWHDENLPVGTLVLVPFYFREIQGVVIRTHQKFLQQRLMKLKEIRSIVENFFLSEVQIRLAEQIAEYYFAPLGSVLKLMIPKAVKQRIKNPKILNKIGKKGKISEVTMKIVKNDRNKFLLVGDSTQREKINIDLIRFYLKKKKQCLILVPEIFFSQSVFEKIQREFFEEVALVHSRITKGQFFDQWKKIKTGEIKIIIASKQGIFLPFFDLGLIVVQEEQDISFKQWESMPRYNAVVGAEFLADLARAKLILESSTPSAEVFERVLKKEIEMIELKKNKCDYPKMEIASFEKGKKNPDFPISNILYGRLAEALKNKKQAVVFVNRRGFSTRTMCENCKKILKCPKCGLALVYSEEGEQYRCLHCAYKMDLLSSCPECGGFQFSHRGIGTQTVEKKIQKIFSSARVARLDADTMKNVVKYKDILQKFFTGEIDILVGTQSVIKGIYSENIGLVAAISGRDFLDGIEFGSRHMAFSHLFCMVNLLKKGGIIVVQSFFGGNPLFNAFIDQDLKKYYKQELAARKKFSYPPFRKFVKLSCRDKSEKNVASVAKKIFDLLSATGNNEVEIIGPYETLSAQKRGLYQRNILLKINSGKNIRDLPIRAVLGKLRKGWSVDVDPLTIY